MVGPTELAKQHAALIAELRPHKQVIAQLIESQLAHALFGDAALVAQASFRRVAEQFGTSTTALFRHQQEHIPARLAQAYQAQEWVQATALAQQVQQQTHEAVAQADSLLERLLRQRGELPPPCRLFGHNVWTVSALIRHIEDRLDQAAKEAEREAKRLGNLSPRPSSSKPSSSKR